MQTAIQIVILNYNGYQDTIACLESLAQLDQRITAQIILIDNGSANESVRELETWAADTPGNFFAATHSITERREALNPNLLTAEGHVFIKSADNYGFAGGNNIGVQIARARQQDYVLLLNNDTVVQPDFLSKLVEFAQQHPDAVLIPQIRLYDHPTKLWNCGGELKWPGRKVYNYGNRPIEELPAQTAMPVSFVTGCALWLKPGIHGELTEQFFFGEEDMEFSLRIQNNGWKAYCVLDSVIYHKVGSTLTKNAKKSTIFILKRLVNLRAHLGNLSLTAARLHYLSKLFTLLVVRHQVDVTLAGSIVREVHQLSLTMTTVPKSFCVDYVMGPAPLSQLPNPES